ncbi:MAG: NAD-dependent epimerase/dehydratase, partial [Frankiales bacterium]|nr:NAD-dependent epimerase/dehydratase [Frankiales bacterium]
LGFDPRLQLCHEDDGIEVLRRCTLEDHPGIFNVGGEGVLLLSQAVRRVGRLGIAIPSPLVTLVGQAFRRAGLVDFSPEQMRYLEHGRVADVSRLEAALGWGPRPTAEAMQTFVERAPRILNPETVMAAERRLLTLMTKEPARA